MYFRPVARLLWCAPSERKGCGSTLGQQELAVAAAVAVGRRQWPSSTDLSGSPLLGHQHRRASSCTHAAYMMHAYPAVPHASSSDVDCSLGLSLDLRRPVLAN